MKSLSRDIEKSNLSQNSIWNDSIIQNYYSELYENFTLKDLDNDFNVNLKILSKMLSKIDDSERKVFIELMSNLINHYVEKKIEKEIESLFNKTLIF